MTENVKKLDRRLGLLHATASNMSTMVGIGPFITFPLIISAMGGPQAMFGWVIGTIIAVSDGQVWAELSTALPGEGGSYIYLKEAYRKYFGKLIAFMFIWSFLLSGPLEIASGLVGMMHYISFIFPWLTEMHLRLLSFGAGVLTIILHYNKIKFVGVLIIILWIIMLSTVVLTIYVGITHFNAAYVFDFPKGWFSFSWGFVLGLGGATLIAMYDLLGYNNICFVEEEVKNPGYVFPRAIIWSVIGVALLYMIMNFLILGVTHWRIVETSTHIVSDIINTYYGHTTAIIVTVLVSLTAYGSVYSLMMAYSRIPFAAARDGFFFNWLKGIHPVKHFPHFSLLVVGSITCIASLFNLDFIIAATLSSRILIQFLGQIIGLTVLRKTRPDLHRPYKMWLYPLPSIIAFAGFAFIFISSGLQAISLGLLWLAVGIIFFLSWARNNHEWPFKSADQIEAAL